MKKVQAQGDRLDVARTVREFAAEVTKAENQVSFEAKSVDGVRTLSLVITPPAEEAVVEEQKASVVTATKTGKSGKA